MGQKLKAGMKRVQQPADQEFPFSSQQQQRGPEPWGRGPEPSGHGVARAPTMQRHQQPVLQHLQTRVLGQLQHVDAAEESRGRWAQRKEEVLCCRDTLPPSGRGQEDVYQVLEVGSRLET